MDGLAVVPARLTGLTIARMAAVPMETPVVVGDQGIILRPFAEEDALAVVEAGADAHIPLITTVPPGCDAEAAYKFIERQWQRSKDGQGYSFAVAAVRGGPAVGQVGVWVQDLEAFRRLTLGYWVVPSQRGKGVASEALALATGWAQEALDPVRCQAFIEPRNVPSWRAAERGGYEREGLLRAWEQIDGEWRDLYAYSTVKG